MATTTVPRLKASLFNLLKARPGLSNVHISWGIAAGEPSADLIMLLNVPHSEISRTTGQHRREDYTLELMISCIANGTDQQTLTLHAFAILAEIELLLTSNTTVGQTVQWATVTSNTLLEIATPTQMEARIMVKIGCVALI